MRRKFTDLFAVPKIRQQIILIFLLSSIIPTCIFGFFAIYSARGKMLQLYEDQLTTDTIRVNSTLFDITTSARISTSSISNSQTYRNLLSSSYSADNLSGDYSSLVSAIQTYRNNSAAISSICVFTDNPTLTENTYVSVMPDGFDGEPWFDALDTSAYNTWVCAPYEDSFGNTNYELTLVEQFLMKDSPYTAYLVTRLDNNYIRNRLVTNTHLIMVSIDGDQIFFSSDRSRILSDMPCKEHLSGQSYQYIGGVAVDDTTFLSSIITLLPYQTDNHFYTLVCDQQAYANINEITNLYLLILLCVTLVPVIIILLFSSYFSKRIEILRRAMHQASIGDYTISVPFSGDDELADTFRDLKTTVEQIHEKESRFYEAQINEQQLINQQQQMEFEMLASQINPHFLYNTLETIRMQAVSADNRDVANSISLLGKAMHHVLENTGRESTTIAKELAHVVTYLKIQQLRFGDRVNYVIQVPPYLNLEHYRILPLLFQPVVENAIVHGLEGCTEGGCIEITFILEVPNLYVTVSDNGDGIDAEGLSRLRERIEQRENPASSIGLRNIHQRMQLLYGLEYGLTVESTLHEGTTVTLTFPLHKLASPVELANTLALREQYLEQEFDVEDI